MATIAGFFPPLSFLPLPRPTDPMWPARGFFPPPPFPPERGSRACASREPSNHVFPSFDFCQSRFPDICANCSVFSEFFDPIPLRCLQRSFQYVIDDGETLNFFPLPPSASPSLCPYFPRQRFGCFSVFSFTFLFSLPPHRSLPCFFFFPFSFLV